MAITIKTSLNTVVSLASKASESDSLSHVVYAIWILGTYTVSTYRVSCAILYYDVVDSELRYRSVDIGYRLFTKSYTILYIRYHMSKVLYLRSNIGYRMHMIL